MVDSKSLGVLSNLGLGVLILVVVLVLFDALRYFYPGIYYYRERASNDPQWTNYDGTPFFALPRPSNRPLSWTVPTFQYPEAQIVRTHGLDVAMYLRFIVSQIKVFAVLSLFTAVVLYPTYITADTGLAEGDPRRAVGIEVVSLANVPDKSGRLWVTLVSEFFVVATICYFLYWDIKAYTKYRRQYRADSNNPSNFAAIVMDIPAASRNEQAIFRMFDTIFPGEVVKIHQVRDAERLYALKNKYLKALSRRERAEWDAVMDERYAKYGRRPTTRYRGRKCDALEYWSAQQDVLAKRVREKESDLDSFAPMTHGAIVVFRSKRAASFAAIAPIWKSENEWRVSRAAEPRGVNWNRIDIMGMTRSVRQYVTFGLVVALTVIWSVPAGFISGLRHFPEIVKRFPSLTFLADIQENSPALASFIEGFLPPLLLFLLLQLIPLIIRVIISFERIHTLPNVEAKIRSYLFMFYTMSNFFYVVIIGSVLKKLQEIFENPSSIVSLLSVSVPAQATFLMKYVLINAFLGSALGMLNIGRLLVRPFLMRGARTIRELRKADGIFAAYPFTKLYALCTMFSLIAYVYSTIAPLICVVALIYYCVAYMCTKFVLLYSHRPMFEGGGIMFRASWAGLLFGLYVHQVSIIAIMSLKLAAPQAVLAGLSFLISVAFHRYCRKTFFLRAKFGTLIDQSLADERDGVEDVVPEHFVDLYIHPGMRPIGDEEDLSGIAPHIRKQTLELAGP